MSHRIYRIVNFKKVKPYTLELYFDDNTSRVVDFFPVLEGAVFGPLKNEAFFNQVEIDPERHTLVWPNGADFDPETLHNWPEYADAFVKMAHKWSLKSVKAA